MLKRSLTIVEVLIALTLILALSAIVVPVLTDSLEERAFEVAADETNEQLMMARAHAQATGQPIEVTYDAQKSQVKARRFSPMDVLTERSADEAAEMSVHEPWALRILASGVRILAHAPKSLKQDSTEATTIDDGLQPGEYETLEDLGKGQEVRLAVFMPDGTALMGDRVWLNDKKGRVGVFTINPWSGLPLFERLANLNAEAKSDESVQK